jgi:acyl-CoA synthetase (NDP forming)
MALAADFVKADPVSRLGRMLAPRSIAFVGGRIADMAIGRCLNAGFDGEIYAVNPSRETMSGYPCYSSVDALPVIPDAAYVGVNRESTIDVVRSLSSRGAGGCVCYAAGYAEIGGNGIRLQERLVEAAGPMPLVGPNCFGFINYVDGCALWPYLFGGTRVDQGVALISQSGNIAMNLTMNGRSVRLTHVICAGNQAVLGPADYLEALLADRRVRAVGIVLEGLDDVNAFAAMAQCALQKHVPIVVMKVGRTPAGAQRANSHTSSLTGSDVLYDAYFDRLGIIRVGSLNRLLEVLKVFDVSGPIPACDIVSLSCSGGEAAIMADLAAEYGLATPPFSAVQARSLLDLFPGYVTVSNPFDYNTSIWGDRHAMQRCFTVSLSGTHHAAILVYDHPSVVADEVIEWIDALDAFVAAHQATGMRAFVVCTLPELLPRELRERLIAAGVTPLQGLDDALFAVAAAAAYQRRIDHSVTPLLPRPAVRSRVDVAHAQFLDEWQSKKRLADFGVPLADGHLGGEAELADLAVRIGFPVVLKACGPAFVHKSELGAVRVGLRSPGEVLLAAEAIRAAVDACGLSVESFLIERMIDNGVAELIVGIHRDDQFGPTLIIGSGGVLVELVGDSVSLLLPTDRPSVERALMSLKVATLLRGFRGKPPGDTKAAIDAILNIASFADAHWATLQELDVNPLIVLPHGQGAVAVDALLRLSEPTGHTSGD